MVGQAVYPSGDGYLVTNGGGLDSRDLTFYLPTGAGYTLVMVLTIEAEEVDPDTHRVLTVICRAHEEDGLHAVDMSVRQAEDTFCASPAAKAIWPGAERLQIRRWRGGQQWLGRVPTARRSREPWRAVVAPWRDRWRFVPGLPVGTGRWCRSATPACPTESGDRPRPELLKPCSGASALRIWLATQGGVPEGETRLNPLSSRSAAGRMRSQSFAAAAGLAVRPSGTWWPQQPPAAH